MTPRLRSALGVVPCAALLLVAGCGESGVAPDGVDSVVLLVIDTLRADDAYDPEVAPHLNALGERSVVFERAFASASYTLASTATLFTGLRPAAHGNLGEQTNVMQPAHRTLAEALSEAGVATAAFSCNPHISRPGGFDQGFGDFGFYGRDTFDEHRVPAAVRADLVRWWQDHAGESRFAYVHVLPPHAPYQPPRAFLEARGIAHFDLAHGLQKRLDDLNREGTRGPRDPAVEELRELYRASILYVDDWQHALHQQLVAATPEGSLGWIVTSDHGEGFMEHGRVSHGFSPYAEQVHVPLLWSWPHLDARREPALVETRSIAATLCDAMGANWPAAERGRSWWRALSESSPIEASAGALSRSMGGRPAWSWRTSEWTHLWQSASGTSALYDTSELPGEYTNLADLPGPRQGLARSLAAALQAALEKDASLRVPIEVPRAHTVFAKELAALGYLANPQDGERAAPSKDDE
jgi:arylsulfatase A-like enzyme